MTLKDADALLNGLEDLLSYVKLGKEHPYYKGEANALNVIIGKIKDAPTVDAVPVGHGRWVFGVDSETGERDLKAWTCSECNEKYPWQPNYCPNCGAKMGGERREEE